MYSQPSDDSRKLLEQAISRMGLSARAYDRILKVARTIADLEVSVNVGTQHVRKQSNIETWTGRFRFGA